MLQMTARQGQYLAFIYYYSKVHGRAPPQADIRVHFKVTPPSVHQMLLVLERAASFHASPDKGVPLSCWCPESGCRNWSNAVAAGYALSFRASNDD